MRRYSKKLFATSVTQSLIQAFNIKETRMHSSRMRTDGCSGCPAGVCPSAGWDMSAWGVSAPVHAGMCLPRRGCLPQCMLGYVCLGGVCPSACWDVPAQEGVSAPVHAGIHPPAPLREENHRCLWKHIRSATTLRTVNMLFRDCIQFIKCYPSLHLRSIYICS